LLGNGIAREVARAVLPVGLYSFMYAICNAHSLMHSLSLQTTREQASVPSFPQREIEMAAEQCKPSTTRIPDLTTSRSPDGVLCRMRPEGERTAGLVSAVTNPAWDPGRDKHEQYREHVAETLDGSAWARVVKVPDITDNAVGLFHAARPSLPRRAGKYLPCCRCSANSSCARKLRWKTTSSA
jgi:hypothetical protein